jgi:sRNA-binding protein
MTYKRDRYESENVIRKLGNEYPKCFFEDPKLRQPLKKTIITDLKKEGFPVAQELLVPAVEWYQSHFSYQYALQTGASRIDLQGKEVSTVTEQEYRKAQKKIREDKQNLTARNLGSSTRTVASLHDAGRIPDDQLKKLDAPMPVAPKKSPAPAPVSESASTSAPELTRLYEALNAANTMLAGASDPALRSAMTSAALGVVIKEAQRVIDSFRESDDT